MSKKRLRRLQWKRMITTEELVSKMNAFVGKINEVLQEMTETAYHIRRQKGQMLDIETD
jgi:hypothetical protein